MLLLADRQATAAILCKIGDPSLLSRKVAGLPRLIVRLALLRAELERADSPSDKPEFSFTVVAFVLVPHCGLRLSPIARMIRTGLSDLSSTYYDC